jgi:hypothetical protein
VRVGDFVALYFSMTSLGLLLIAYEKDYYNMKSNLPSHHEDVRTVSILMWVAFGFNFIHILSLVLRHMIYFKWLFVKKLITKYDNLRTTGYWKIILGEIFFQILIPYPFLNELKYYETNGRWMAKDVMFKYNHILLAIMTITRIYQLIKALLLITYWTAPRA